MLVIALFTIDPNWKLLKCPSVGEWLSKPWHIQTMEPPSTIKEQGIDL